MTSETTPLTPKPDLKMSQPPISPMVNGSIASLAVMRMLVGGITVLIPMRTALLFGVPVAAPAIVVARLFGARDFVLGGLLWTARPNNGNPATGADATGNRELKRALWAGVMADLIDVGSCAVGVLDGTLPKRAIVGVGVGAAFFAGLGGILLKSV